MRESFALALGFLGHVLLWCWVITLIRATWLRLIWLRLTWLRLNWLLYFFSVPAAWMSHGWFDDLSVTTIVLLVTSLWASRHGGGKSFVAARTHLLPWGVLILTGALLYASTLGFLPWSLYAETDYLPWGVGVIAAYCLWQGPSSLGQALIIALLAHGLRLTFSENLWNLVMDPLLWFYSLYCFVTLLRLTTSKKLGASINLPINH